MASIRITASSTIVLCKYCGRSDAMAEVVGDIL